MIIYKTTNLISGKIYIGQDSKNNDNYFGSGLILKRAIKKYGKKNFKKETIDICDNKEDLDLKEQYWIGYYNSVDETVGYNIANGGGGCIGCKHSDESKDKMSINTSGDKNPMFGKSLETYWKEIGLSDDDIILKLQTKTQKWLDKVYKHSDLERSELFGASKSGDENPFYNKKHTLESKEIMSEKANKKIVLQYDLDGNFIKQWESTMQVYREMGINCRKCCRGVYKTACGFLWLYKEGIVSNKILVDQTKLKYSVKWTEKRKKDVSIRKTGCLPTNKKFTEIQIYEILKLREDKVSCKIIAKKYLCGLSTIKNISRGKTYKEFYKNYKLNKTKS